MAIPWLPILTGIGAAGSLLGGIGQMNAANQSNALQQGQLDLLKKVQEYQFSRQAQLDPIFLNLLSQSLVRSSRVPKMFGAYGKGVAPLAASQRGYRAALPAPKLIGAQ